jgi:long-chain acyl-CoA synthetase
MNRTVKVAAAVSSGKLAGRLAGMVVALFAAVALAAEVGGVKLDDKVSMGAQELVLNGAGVRTRVVFKVYVASLYLPQKATELATVLSKSPRRIQLNLLRTLAADQLVEALNEGLAENNTAAELAAVKSQVDQLATIMKSFKEVKEKDVITLDFVDGATRIGLNGEAKGSIGGDAFNQALIKVWLGDKPVQADLKKSLLGA